MSGPMVETVSERAREGLSDMLTAAIGDHDLMRSWVDMSEALLFIELAKAAPDKPEWFPRGKAATIQQLQSNVDAVIKTISFTSDRGDEHGT